MIDPNNITKFNRTKHELEELLLFCIVVAGKRAHVQAKKLEEFLKGNMPFSWIRVLNKEGILEQHLKNVGLGQYKRIAAAFTAVSEIDWYRLNTCSAEWLATFYGIGLKTAKLFILHSRANQRMAVLDTHVLQALRLQFPLAKVPRQSPSDPRKYKQLECLWLGWMYQQGVDSMAEADLNQWKQGSKNETVTHQD